MQGLSRNDKDVVDVFESQLLHFVPTKDDINERFNRLVIDTIGCCENGEYKVSSSCVCDSGDEYIYEDIVTDGFNIGSVDFELSRHDTIEVITPEGVDLNEDIVSEVVSRIKEPTLPFLYNDVLFDGTVSTGISLHSTCDKDDIYVHGICKSRIVGDLECVGRKNRIFTMDNQGNKAYSIDDSIVVKY